MRISYLLMVHTASPQIERLVDRLRTPEDRFFVHVDKKTPADAVVALRTSLGTRPGLQFVSERFDVRYFAYSMVEAMLATLRAAEAAGDYDYAILISAAHYPLVPPAGIKAHLAAHPGKSFVWSRRMKTGANQPLERVQAHWLDRGEGRLLRFPPRWFTDRIPYQRRFIAGWIPYSGSQWFCLSRAAVRYTLDLLRTRPEIERFFRTTYCPDESMFPSILLNGPLVDDIVCDNLIYDRWTPGHAHPAILDDTDLEPARRSKKLFARKVDAAMADALDLVLDTYGDVGTA